GFDSIPHDLGALYTAQKLQNRGSGPMHIRGYVAAKGSVSGGTWHSLLGFLGKGRNHKKPVRTSKPRSGPRPRGVHFADDIRRWVTPLPTIDPQVVRRSAELAPDPFGENFRYHHYLSTKSFPQLAATLVGVGSIAALAQLGPTRRMLKKLRPSGDGPNRTQRARNWFKVTFVGTRGRERVVTRVSGGDPGYGETSKMLAESALTLVHDRDKLPIQGGVVTTASALGTHLIARLQAAGIGFEVLD
ncbi:MAG: saccharopine dehydrogenase, partial [Nannocystaceae bacterium]